MQIALEDKGIEDLFDELLFFTVGIQERERCGLANKLMAMLTENINKQKIRCIGRLVEFNVPDRNPCLPEAGNRYQKFRKLLF